MKRFFSQSLQWLSALMLAVLICNGVLFFYNRPTGFINRTKASTNTIFYPGSSMLHGTEGHGFYTADSNGYLNPNLPIAEKYAVIVGASHTQGEEVSAGKRYADVLNSRLTDGSSLAAYICAQDGLFLPKIIQNFVPVTQEFSDAQAIVIETGHTAYTSGELDQALKQKEFDEKNLGANIASRMNGKAKLIIKVKEALPIYTIAKNQIAAYKAKEKAQGESGGDEINLDEYTSKMDKALAAIRSQWSKPIIIMYHPGVTINPDGTMTAVEEPTDKAFEKLCEKNGIDYINTGSAFEKAYRESHTVPYGFSDTSMGTGHLNKDGHRLAADCLYGKLEEVLAP